MDLLQADNRRRQANFLRQNPTFRISNSRHKLTDTSNKALTNLAANSLYFKKSNTLKRTQKSVQLQDDDRELEEKAARKVAMQDSSSLLGEQSMDSVSRREKAKKIHIIELDGMKENEGQ